MTKPARRRRPLGPLGWRLFAAFTLVGVGAVALLAVLAVLSVRSQATGLVAAQRERARHDIAASLGDAYAKAGSWQNADLTGVQALARSDGAQLVVLNASGGRVATITPGPQDGHEPGHNTPSPGMSGGDHGQPGVEPSHVHHGADGVAAAQRPVTASSAAISQVQASDRVPVMAGGQRVGTVLVDFPAVTDMPAWQARDAIVRVVGGGAAMAIVLAAAAALIVTRRATRPLTALAAAAGALERGDPDAIALLRPGPGELGQVSAAFARMAVTLQREDELRRALIADTAHELRTPVTILRGSVEEMLDGLAEPTTQKLTSLHDEVLRLQAVSRNHRAAHRPLAGSDDGTVNGFACAARCPRGGSGRGPARMPGKRR